ncbi:hypothetical protein [Actinomadura kijaniata]|uniref:hypothetical protein n=1 Tax=Actinomadura kijaniata TaxID=46161 RepID=UPI00082FF8C4|nr:hypothetical protein [Actinomadura kijaniata]
MTMPGYRTYAPPSAPERAGMAKSSLVLGIVGLAGLALCFAGLVPALVGLVLGAVALARGTSARSLAAGGVAVSLAALVLGGGFLAFLLTRAAECGDEARYPDHSARERCIDQKFPFAQTSSTTGSTTGSTVE